MRNSGEGGDSLGVAEEDELRKGETLEEMREHGQERAGKGWTVERLKNFGAEKIFFVTDSARLKLTTGAAAATRKLALGDEPKNFQPATARFFSTSKAGKFSRAKKFHSERRCSR